MTEDRRRTVAKIISKAWTDPDFKQRLLDHPREVLEEYEMEVPPGLTIHMHADTPTLEHGVIPAPPPGLTPEQLRNPKNVHIVYCFTAFHHGAPFDEEGRPG